MIISSPKYKRALVLCVLYSNKKEFPRRNISLVKGFNSIYLFLQNFCGGKVVNILGFKLVINWFDAW
ncbi:hypothetical protein Mgra_00006988 [Meloidogyne graminicola]|uniref:Uncharacterized protein n=1 Tax=Meloidogyne graminicola TaxID=189291 RepID=A0A8S9ZJV3_9BILA|nr:hypothetical protein Mgra_00006988 [Meloidogyne graminicola]